MLIGHGFNRLEQRITKALCSGRLGPKEAFFCTAFPASSRSIESAPSSASNKPIGYTQFSHAPRKKQPVAPPSPGRPLAPAGLLLHLCQKRTLPNPSDWRELLLVSTASIGLTRNRRGRSTSTKHLSQRHRPKFSSSLSLLPLPHHPH